MTPHIKTALRHVPNTVAMREDYGNDAWLVVLRSEAGTVEIGPLSKTAAMLVQQAIIGDYIKREWLDDYDRERMGIASAATRGAGMTA